MRYTSVIALSIALIATITANAQRTDREETTNFTLNQLESSTIEVFETIDVDENGSINIDEIDLLRDDSGEPLDLEEFASRGRRLGLINHYFRTDEEIDRFEVGDSNKDGSMTRREFDELSSNLRTHRLTLGLKALDTNNNGNVELREFTAHLDSFDDWDTDGNGSLDRREISGIAEDNRVNLELYRQVFNLRLEEQFAYETAIREQRAAAAEGQEQPRQRRLPPIYPNGSAANIEKLREASKNTFNLLDANNSGSITLDELDISDELIEGEDNLPTEKLTELRQRAEIISYTFLNVEEAVDRFKVADTNLNGSLSETEFNLLGTSVRRHILQLNLDSYDTDKSGSIVLREFSAHLDNIEEIDADGDGDISPKEMRGVVDFRLNMDVHVYQSDAFSEARKTETPPQAQVIIN